MGGVQPAKNAQHALKCSLATLWVARKFSFWPALIAYRSGLGRLLGKQLHIPTLCKVSWTWQFARKCTGQRSASRGVVLAMCSKEDSVTLSNVNWAWTFCVNGQSISGQHSASIWAERLGADLATPRNA